MAIYTIIGASRGVGLELVRQLLRDSLLTQPQSSNKDNSVFAIVRNKNSATHLAPLLERDNVHAIEADAAKWQSLKAAASSISTHTHGILDVLINVSAKTGGDDHIFRSAMHTGEEAELESQFFGYYQTNTLGFVHALNSFLPLLRASTAPLRKVIQFVDGSCDRRIILAIKESGMAAWASAESAKLILIAKYAVELKEEKIVVVGMTPGFVNTSGTAPNPPTMKEMMAIGGIVQKVKSAFPDWEPAPQTPEQAVRKQLKIVDELQIDQTGLLLNSDEASSYDRYL
ncbi:hypothetical protein BT69DRAFT_1237777 [Atractiella rhizophila]|nr:hypothetical protein BT69DRAFT_1237777 [Atractiella rhizophila]